MTTLSIKPANTSKRMGPLMASLWDDAEIDRGDNWLLSYIDILTLFLTLFVVLLVLQPKEQDPNLSVASVEEVTIIDPANSEVIPLIVPPVEQNRSADPSPMMSPVEVISDRLNIDEQLDEMPLLAQAALESEPDRVEPLQERVELIEPIELPLTMELSVAMSPEQPILTAEPAEKPIDKVMKKLVADGLSERLQITQIKQGVHLEVRDNILFSPGSVAFKVEGRELLNDLSKVLMSHEGIISIEGHTDNRPIASSLYPSNWELSSSRATMVARYLIRKGLKPEQLRAVGYADTRPLELNDTEQGRQRNRRVSLIVQFPDS